MDADHQTADNHLLGRNRIGCFVHPDHIYRLRTYMVSSNSGRADPWSVFSRNASSQLASNAVYRDDPDVYLADGCSMELLVSVMRGE